MRQQSVVSLDPISQQRKKQDSPISRLFKTRRFRGKRLKPCPDFGHWLYVGKQGSSKTSSMIWTYEFLEKRWKKKGYFIFRIFREIRLDLVDHKYIYHVRNILDLA